MILDERLARHGKRLRRNLAALYGDGLWPRLEGLLRARHGERDAELTALDTSREADPGWFTAPDMLGYKAYAGQFGGALAGIGAHIDHLQGLGVHYLHLLSVLKSREGDSDGGFAVADYLAVEPALGTMADLEALTRNLRTAGISLSIDLALNHTADDHAWALAAKAGDPHYRAFYHVIEDEENVRHLEAALPQVFPVTAPGNFTFVPDLNGWAWTSFYPFQWDLNWANPEVFLAMADALLRLANHGVEAFRLDSIAYIWKDPGTDCRSRPHAHTVIRAMRALLDIAAPGCLLLGEAVVATHLVPAWFGDDDEPECHLVYNNSQMVAGWLSLAEGTADAVRRVIDASGGLPANANWLSYARCHDDIGWGALGADLGGDVTRLKAAMTAMEGGNGWARGEPFQTADSSNLPDTGLHGTNGTLAALCGLDSGDPRAFDRIALMQALMLASGGLATLYMGDETGAPNDYSYLSDPQKAHDGRWVQRAAIDWNTTHSSTALTIRKSWNRLRAGRISSGPVTTFDTGHPAVLGLACGTTRVWLNFSEEPAHVSAASLLPLGVMWREA